MVKIGDIFEITLSDERKALGHFVYLDKKFGPFIQVFNFITSKDAMNIEEATSKGYLFPPVITGLKAAVRSGLWPVIGKKAISDFIYPKFLNAYWNDKTGEVRKWFLFDGVNSYDLGAILPEDYKSLEFFVVWSPYAVIERIETGIVPFPFGDMIKYNRYTPIVQG